MTLSSYTCCVHGLSASFQASLNIFCQSKTNAFNQGVRSSTKLEKHMLEELHEENCEVGYTPLTLVVFAITPNWVNNAEGCCYLQLDEDFVGAGGVPPNTLYQTLAGDLYINTPSIHSTSKECDPPSCPLLPVSYCQRLFTLAQGAEKMPSMSKVQAISDVIKQAVCDAGTIQ
ncbi:hypothetical protein DSO57_1033303 [Entomophthora muscae]|uniref:Uncharacterized protein n=1 Tax=Entomophthora muscae TaxID=34485 RepID=A0ACC2SD68_9FUNG|nr:hypothetical protein DSO57_1033303 [Entomophthora muscae]